MRHVSVALLLAEAFFGCRREPTPAPAVSASPAAQAPSIAEAKPKPKPWYEGTWTGTYDASLHRIELPAGGVREWKSDDGKSASGKGNVRVTIDPDGQASGEAEGPLGALGVNGSVDGETVRLEFAPRSAENTKDYHGVAVLARRAELLRGSLSASSGDSLSVRQAELELRAAQSGP